MRLHMFNTYFLPVNFQFFSDQHGGRGATALAHFGTCVANHDGLVGIDINPGIDLLVLVGLCISGQAKAQTQSRCGAGADLQKAASIDGCVLEELHDLAA